MIELVHISVTNKPTTISYEVLVVPSDDAHGPHVELFDPKTGNKIIVPLSFIDMFARQGESCSPPI